MSKRGEGTRELRRHSATVGRMTALSRVLGFAREMLMADLFGISLAKSAFDVAFRVPNLFRRLFGEGALSAAFIPMFSDVLEREGREAAATLAARTAGLLAGVLSVIVGIGVVGCHLAAGWVEEGTRAAAVLPLLAIMLPYALLICLVALVMGALNAMRHFALPAFTPVVLNVVWIIVLVAVCPFLPDQGTTRVTALAWGILGAGGLQLVIQLPLLRRLGLRPRLEWGGWHDPRVRRVLILMAPAAVGMGVIQLNVCIDGILAMWAADWAPAALTYAERLVYLPLGIFATALGTVLLPTFSRQAAQEDTAAIHTTLNAALRHLSMIMTPAAVGLLIMAGPIVRLAFQSESGKFDDLAVLRTTRALWCYAPGLLVFSFQKALAPVFFALKDTLTPTRVAVRIVGLNLVLNILFVMTWPVEWKHAGLACATVLCSGVNAFVLGRLLHRRIGSPGWRQIGATSVRCMLAAIGMAAVLMLVMPTLQGWAGSLTPGEHLTPVIPKWVGIGRLRQLVSVGGAMVLGAGVYGLLLAGLCRREARALLATLRRRKRTS